VGELILSGPQVTDQCLQHVSRMKGLGSLSVRRAAITDQGLASLAQLQGLSTLSLLYVPITDAALPDLTRLRALASLRLYGTQLSPAGTERLKGVFGETADIRRGAFLGVGCDPGQEGCVVYLVRSNTPAEKAGLMVNDVLVEYEGQKLPDYKSLTTLVGQDEPGKTISLKILRGTETIVKQIKLGEW
jgi:predicted metalloprotease with PDZ domain